MSRDASIAESEHFPASSRGRPGRIARRWLRHLPAALLLLILLLLSGPPIIGVLLTSLQTGAYSAHPEWTLANYAGLVREVGAGGAILNSLIFALGASTVALLFGLPMALIVERTDTAFRHLGYVIAIMFSAVPATVYAIAWMLMFSRQGFANVSFGYLADLLGYEFQPLQITNMAGMILVEGLNYVPLAFLLLAGPVRSMDTSLEEAALTSGAEPWQVFWRITIPPLVPAVVATLLLTFVRSIESFSIPAILGLPGRVAVMTTEIYATTMVQLPPQYGEASAYGVVLMIVVMAILYPYTRMTAQASRYAVVTGKAFKARVVELGRWRHLTLAFLAVFFIVAVLLPFAILVIASLQKFYAGASFANLSFAQYEELFRPPLIVRSFVDSAIVGIAAATLIMLLSFAAAWIVLHGSSRLRRTVEIMVSLPLVLPGIVLGLSLLEIYANLPFPIYGTLAALVGASLIRFMPFGFRYAHAGLMQVHGELEEAGLMSGATRLQTMLRILMPLVALPLIGGFIYVFMMSVRELEASVLLVTGSTPMVATSLLNLFQNGYIPQVAAFSTVIVLVFGCLGYVFYVIARRYGLGDHSAPIHGRK